MVNKEVIHSVCYALFSGTIFETLWFTLQLCCKRKSIYITFRFIAFEIWATVNCRPMLWLLQWTIRISETFGKICN